ncbi:MAG: MFS transporter [Deltaproteobacteria bacterium]|jgi:MFS family permease|nr:MFS transporter [Deltaproteobacteria bacterium]
MHNSEKPKPDAGSDDAGQSEAPARRKILAAACLAHLTNDGITDMLYVFFPVWQQLFALSFAQVGLLKTLFSGAMAAFQIPAGYLAGGLGLRPILVGGAVLTGLPLLCGSLADSVLVLGICLVLGGMGASAQHPLASAAISHIYSGKASRVALSTYNFTGDLGKLLYPALAAFLIVRLDWQPSLCILALTSLAAGFVIMGILHSVPLRASPAGAPGSDAAQGGSFMSAAFAGLMGIGMLDSATRMGFLTFLPFLLLDKGADMSILGLALGLIFAGGAVGKLLCGIIAARAGALRTVIITESATAALIFAMVPLPLWGALCLCPLLGVILNGTSSIIYGSVPELAGKEAHSRAFAVLYTAAVGAGAVSPYFYGLLGDQVGVTQAMQAAALIILLTVPLTIPLRGKLSA